jgi:hypothetical protein
MINASLLYIIITFLLALFDAIRIRIVYGKKPNIDHKVSTYLALIAVLFSITIYHAVIGNPKHWGWFKFAVLLNAFGWPLCALVRVAVYPVLLNLFRIITKTNPTVRLDYVSDKTDSKVDNLPVWRKLSFWQQRCVAVFCGQY